MAEAARRLRVQPRTVYRLLARGELHGIRRGRAWRVPVDELARFSRTHAGMAAAGGPGDEGAATEGPPPIVRIAERMRPLMERSSDATVLLDRDGLLLYVSPSITNVLGYTPAEFATAEPFSYVHPDDLPLVLAGLAGIVDRPGARATVQVRARHQDGSWRWTESTAINLLDDPDVRAVVANVRDVTPQREAEAALRTSRDQLLAILASVAAGITVQEGSGRLIYANDSAARLIGFPSVEALLQAGGAAVLAAFRVFDEAGELLPPELLPGRVAAAEGRPVEQLLRYQTVVTGEERWSIVRAVPVLDERGAVCFAVNAFQDVTAIKQAERSLGFLAEASRLLTSSLDYEATLRAVTRLAVPELADVCVVDLLDAAGQLQRFAVTTPEGVPDEPAWAVGRQPLNPDAPHGPARVLRTGEPELLPEVTEEIVQQAARSPEHARMLRELGITSHMIVPLRSRGELLGLITFVSAGSGRRYAERDLALAQELAQRTALAIDNARLYEEARQALSETQAALAVRDQFLSIASHELRTPLTSLKGHLELGLRRLRRNMARADVEHSLETAAGQVDRLNRLVGELLDVSRLTGGRFSISPEPLDLAEHVRRIVEAERAIEPPRTILLEAPAEPLPVSADAGRIEQVLVNLLHNARKYSPEDTVIRVTLVATPDGALISVQDEGIGIPPADLPSLFTPFHRAANVDRAVSGLGLGLYIAREIVHVHGGTLTVESTPGAGSTFTVTLPGAAVGD